MKKQIVSTLFALNMGLVLPMGAETALAVEIPVSSSAEQISSEPMLREASVATGPSFVATGSSIQTITPTQATASSNQNGQHYGNWMHGAGIQSYIYENKDGGITRVEHIGNKVVVEDYDSNFQIQYSGQLDMELPSWGGAYSGTEYNFLVFAQSNPNHDNNVEVYRIVRYTKDWERVDSASLFATNTARPFAFGTLRMVEAGDSLLIQTCHDMYNGHQSNLFITVNIPTMKATVGGGSYSSHSLNQLLATDGSVLVGIDHGDYYPRSIRLTEYKPKNNGSLAFANSRSVTALKINGSGVYTGVTVGSLVISNQSYLTAGTSVPQVTPYNTGATRNLYVTSTSREDISQTQVYWLTNYGATEKVSVSVPHMVKINDDCILVLYTVDGKINYTYINAEGKQISETSTMEGSLSNCVPILYNGKVVWYYTNKSIPVFCSIDPADTTFVDPFIPTSPDNSSSNDSNSSDDDYYYDNSSSSGSSSSSYEGKEVLNSSEQAKVTDAVRTVLGTNTAIASVQKTETGICITSKSGDVIYSKADGSLAINEWEKVGTDWYYFDADKKAAKGWKHLGDKWYYLDDISSKMVTGWKKTASGNWFYLDTENGDMKTGWQFVNNNWYYLDTINGDMKSDWQFVNGNWYYLDSINGDMKTGWQFINNNWYYMDAINGNCLINTTTPDGYITDENGAWIP